MVFVLDNYDSFTYNLVQYLGELGAEVEVCRNDELTVEEVEALKPERILLSPGPCTPQDAGILVPLIRHMAGKAPILGVCLGHQAIGEAFGGQVVRAQHLMHGKTSSVEHDGKGVFAGLPTPLTCTRYHSLIVAEDSLPRELDGDSADELLQQTAATDNQLEAIAKQLLQHRRRIVFGGAFWQCGLNVEASFGQPRRALDLICLYAVCGHDQFLERHVGVLGARGVNVRSESRHLAGFYVGCQALKIQRGCGLDGRNLEFKMGVGWFAGRVGRGCNRCRRSSRGHDYHGRRGIRRWCWSVLAGGVCGESGDCDDRDDIKAESHRDSSIYWNALNYIPRQDAVLRAGDCGSKS